MDDDLMSLRGSGSSPSGGSPSLDDNPLGLGLDDFTPAPPAPTAPAASAAPAAPIAPAASAASASKAKAAAPASKKKPASRPKPKRASRGGGGFMGMSPQQGMLLSIFLFLDVAVLGCLVLIALGALKLGG